MRKIAFGVVAAVAIGTAGIAAWQFLGTGSAPTDWTKAPPIDCSTIAADVDAAFGMLPPTTKASYNGLACTPDKLSFDELRFMAIDTDGTPGGALILTDLVIDGAFATNARQLFAAAPAGSKPGPITLPLARNLTIAKVTIGSAENGLSLESLKVAGLSGRTSVEEPALKVLAIAGLPLEDALWTMTTFAFERFESQYIRAARPATLNTPSITYLARRYVSAGFDGTNFTSAETEVIYWETSTPEMRGKYSCDKLEQHGYSLNAMIAAIKAQAAGPMPQTYDPKNIEALPAIAKALLQTYSEIKIDREAAQNCAFEMKGSAGDYVSKIGSYIAEDYSFLRAKRMAAEDVQVDIYDMQMSLSLRAGRTVIYGVDYASALAPLSDGTGKGPDLSKLKVEGYEITGLAIGPSSYGPKVQIASIKADSTGYVDGVPGQTKAKLTGLMIPAAMLPNPDLALGYEALNVDASLDYRYDDTAKSFEVDDLTLALADGGVLSLSLALRDFDLRGAQQGFARLLPPVGLAGAKLGAFRLHYADGSLVNRVLDLFAKRDGETREGLLAMVRDALGRRAATAPGPVLRAAIEGVARFLAAPRTLTVTAIPTRTVTLAEFGGLQDNPEGLAKALALTVEANCTGDGCSQAR